MLFGLLIDYICRITLIGLAVIVVGFIVSVIILSIGEKRNWWK